MSTVGKAISINVGRRDPSDRLFKVWWDGGELFGGFLTQEDAELAAAQHWIELNGNGAAA